MAHKKERCDLDGTTFFPGSFGRTNHHEKDPYHITSHMIVFVPCQGVGYTVLPLVVVLRVPLSQSHTKLCRLSLFLPWWTSSDDYLHNIIWTSDLQIKVTAINILVKYLCFGASKEPDIHSMARCLECSTQSKNKYWKGKPKFRGYTLKSSATIKGDKKSFENNFLIHKICCWGRLNPT